MELAMGHIPQVAPINHPDGMGKTPTVKRHGVLLYSDKPVLAYGFKGLIDEYGDEFILLRTCKSFEELAAAALDIQPALVIVDYTREVTYDSVREFMKNVPKARVMIWAETIQLEMAYQVLMLGISGVIMKSEPGEILVSAIRQILKGGRYIPTDMANEILTGRRIAVTPREGQLIQLLARGMKNKEIAWQLKISEGTVKVYMSRLFAKLGVDDRLQLALFAQRNLAPEGGKIPSTALLPPPINSLAIYN